MKLVARIVQWRKVTVPAKPGDRDALYASSIPGKACYRDYSLVAVISAELGCCDSTPAVAERWGPESREDRPGPGQGQKGDDQRENDLIVVGADIDSMHAETKMALVSGGLLGGNDQ
ncbi:hypothetical protein N7509_004589 [Penicillium cosmopolitanum]|uniref:Uncharacterized protein n=1 Tax=Penicillium cosmopolitanum TaxID=1131564 RepID=A0A9W9W0Z7_9EURO|nr:uncharacterized protein N7509_004589 [Penicillium cosmopolitanum]KAJ5396476.1 hypothetical protein N7509_004589 [Penicillium cosmopolitanum]